MEIDSLFQGVYKDRKVLVTGHTGFKGTWLCLWLTTMGANVIGISLDDSPREHFDQLNLDMTSHFQDISQPEVIELIKEIKPEIVFHLAAQALVRESYENPVFTYQSNVIGSLHIYEACRQLGTVKAVVSVTTDKVYENREWLWSYREIDRLGGKDPYSASKACVEILTSSYRDSFFPISEFGKTHETLIASARSGNVIGGGDWARDRLIPDAMRLAFNDTPFQVRNPEATRPWQHVLDPLSGYLQLGQRLLSGKLQAAEAWNFAPNFAAISVRTVATSISKLWEKVEFDLADAAKEPHEAHTLQIDNSKAKLQLSWEPLWQFDRALEVTVRWYKAQYLSKQLLSMQDLTDYLSEASRKKLEWAAC